ncbi:MAG TPA: carbohydrate ABC transporter permease [Thermomicrobiales bacterium]|nr:carbohydrate ABC transporter permease [Thermomicrobiales bacterium]
MSTATNTTNQGRLLPADLPPDSVTAPQESNRGRRRRNERRINKQVLPRIILILMCALFILPFYWMITLGLKSNTELAIYPPTLWPHDPQWGNFQKAIDTVPFWRATWNTSVITFFTVVGALISNPFIAYGFSRLEWPGRDKVFMIVLATVFMPFPVIIVALFDIYSKLGWVNTILPLVVPMFLGNAFWIFLMRQFMMQIPMDLSDAARIDGANEFQIFFRIVLPQTLPALGVIAIFAFMHAWNDFLGPLLFLLDSKKYTLALVLTYFRQAQAYDVQFNLMMAAATLMILPVIVLFLLFQRSFIGGISVGSIK